MSQSCRIEEDNISIEIDPGLFDKPDSQLTEELYEMARRIAESDRNNEAYRQAKKSKSLELETLKHNKKQLEGELEKLNAQIGEKRNRENDNTFSKNNRIKFQQINVMCEDLGAREKEVQKNTCQILKENQKLQKKLAVLQVEYEIMLKQNKHKSNLAAKLSKTKEQKMDLIRQNQQKIIQLQNQCENTKKRAEDLQLELKEQLKNEQQLEELIKQREIELETQRKSRQETYRKQEENKKALLKMVNSAKAMQNEIDNKLKEGHRLQNIHQNLRHKIAAMEQQQKKLDEFMINRKNTLATLRQISSRASREEQTLTKLKANREKGEQ